MSVVVTLNSDSKLNALVFAADDYEFETLESGETVVNVLAAADDQYDARGYAIEPVEPLTIATVRDWSAVAIDPGKPAELIEQVKRATGDAAPPCEACAKREERLADWLARQQRVRDQFFDDIRNRGNG